MTTITTSAPLKELCGLTQEQFEIFKSACNQTYQQIGHDFGDGGRSQAEQIEVICDADYIHMHGRPWNFPKDQNWSEFYKTVIDPMISANYGKPVFKKMMKKVFPFARYE